MFMTDVLSVPPRKGGWTDPQHFEPLPRLAQPDKALSRIDSIEQGDIGMILLYYDRVYKGYIGAICGKAIA